MKVIKVLSKMLFLLLAFPFLANADTTNLQFGSVSTSPYVCTSSFQGYFGNNPVILSSTTSSPPFTALDVEPGELGYNGKPTICIQFDNSSTPGAYSRWVRTQWTNNMGGQYEADVYCTGTWISVGSIYPKYQVLAVWYAPPGSHSNVNYGSSTAMGTSKSWDDSFSSSTTVTTSFTGGIPIAGSLTSTTPNTWGQ
jgi:hypothetical protein